MAEAEVIRLVVEHVSSDTVRALEQLLLDARAGRIVGLAYVAMHKVYDYTVDAAGECRRSPTLARGMLARLDDELSKLTDHHGNRYLT